MAICTKSAINVWKQLSQIPSVQVSMCAWRYTPAPAFPAFSKAQNQWHTWTNQPNAESRKRSRQAFCRSIACNCKHTIDIKVYYHITSWVFSKGNWYLKLSSSWRTQWNKRRTISKNKAMKIKKTHPQTCWSKSP